MSQVFRILDQAVGRPLLLTPEKAMVIYDVLAGRAPAVAADLATAEAALVEVPGEDEDAKAIASIRKTLGIEDRPEPGAYRNVQVTDRYGRAMPLYPNINGVAQITIDGSLVNRGAYIGASSGVVSYEGIRAQIRTALADEAVKAIIIDMNSPGGQAGGMFALAAEVRAAAQQKPVVGFVNDMAASAGYGIISGCTEIVVSPSSIVGSIGVVLLHLDRSGELAQKGISPTLIHAGARKVDGNPFGPLPENVRSALQSEVDKIYDLFLGAVAEGRGRKMPKKAARATEANVFMGQEAIDVGLADAMASIDQVFDALSRGKKVASLYPQKAKGAAMSGEQIQPGASAPAAPSVDAGAVKARIKGIMTSDEAKGREALASHLAYDTEATVEDAKKMLALAPAGASAEAPPAPAAAAPAADPAKSYADRKAGDAALGLAAVDPGKSKAETAKAGWGAAVSTVNRTIR